MLEMLITFMLTTILYIAVSVWGARWFIHYLKTNPKAAQTVTDVLAQKLGRKQEEDDQEEDTDKKKPVRKDSLLC
jgi:hypothetical protein